MKKYYSGLRLDYLVYLRMSEKDATRHDRKGKNAFPLWDLMHLFGEAMYMGNELPFDTTELEILPN